MEKLQCAIPDFGGVLTRRQLLDAFRNHSPGLIIVCAPAGFGKSVLAAQFAQLSIFNEAFWIGLHDLDTSGEGVLARISSALLCEEESDLSGIGAASLRESMTCADSIIRIRELFLQYAGKAVCVVVDGANHLSEINVLREALKAIQDSTSQQSRLVVTCRQVERIVPLEPSGVWVIESPDLRFSVSEVEQLVQVCASDLCCRPDVSALYRNFGGQPALTSIMLRHSCVCEDDRIPQDLLWYAERVVSSVSVNFLEALYVAAVMQEGLVSDLRLILMSLHCMVDWKELLSLTPLLNSSSQGDTGRSTFRSHAVLGEALNQVEQTWLMGERTALARKTVYEHLNCAREYGLLFSALERHGTFDELQCWFELAGCAMLRTVGPAAVEQCLDRIPPGDTAGSWRLLLLHAMILRQQENSAEAVRHASLAHSLAELEDDQYGVVNSALLIGRLAIDDCQFEKVRTVLAPLDAVNSEILSTEAECLVQSYLAAVESHAGLLDSAICRTKRTRTLLRAMDAKSEEAVFATNAMASVDGVCQGMWSEVVAFLPQVVPYISVAPLQRLAIRSNCAAASYEVGRLTDARQTILDVLRQLEVNGLDRQRAYSLGTYSAICFAEGDMSAGMDAYLECERLCLANGDLFGHAAESATACSGLRAAGFFEEALLFAERSLSLVANSTDEYSLLYVFIRAELAACLLATGDTTAAVKLAAETREEVADVPARMHLLRLDLTLAEAERACGAFERAVARVAVHSQYIMTGSANTMLSLYVRAFPGLLAVLCVALSVQNMPLRMLKLLPPETIEKALAAMDSYVSPQVSAALLECFPEYQLSGVRDDVKPEFGDHSDWPCYVRLFGGLEVKTEYGVVDDTYWRKRKARLLFAMLVVRRGQDLSRDVILERLWPDMDEGRARRNFYVTWSTMKQALACGAAARLGAVYVCSIHDVCRIARSVRSDLDDFHEAISQMRKAIIEGNTSRVIDFARWLKEIYRGDLLPGDIYEDWFAEVRDQLRHEFCDAMVQAARIAEGMEDPDTALVLLRPALTADPWREDAYQGMIRCEIARGQRNRAMEMYICCRRRLVEDLGIDPSPETTRLYQIILAMDDDISPVADDESEPTESS